MKNDKKRYKEIYCDPSSIGLSKKNPINSSISGKNLLLKMVHIIVSLKLDFFFLNQIKSLKAFLIKSLF